MEKGQVDIVRGWESAIVDSFRYREDFRAKDFYIP